MSLPRADWTPEEKSRILAEMRARFTDEDALEFERVIASGEPLTPLDDLIRWTEEAIRQSENESGLS